MNKIALLTALVSFLYFAYMKSFSTHTVDVADFVIMVFATLFFGAWMVAVLVIALESGKEEEKNNLDKSC